MAVVLALAPWHANEVYSAVSATTCPWRTQPAALGLCGTKARQPHPLVAKRPPPGYAQTVQWRRQAAARGLQPCRGR